MADDKDGKKGRILPSGNPHDAYFKTVMGEARNAKDLFYKHLPGEMTCQFAPGLPELIQGSFVDEDLSVHLSDMLYRVKLKTGSEAFVYTLIEHKSSPDALAPLQLLRYMVRIWVDWTRENRGKKLPVIIPLVFYHGKRRWRVPTRFSMMFENTPEALQCCIPDFLHELVDLGQVENKELSNDPRLAALLMAMKHIFAPNIMLELAREQENLLSLETIDFQLFLSYIIHTRQDIGREDVGKILDLLPLSQQEDIMAGLAQEFKDDWFAKGEAQGKLEGRLEGKLEGKAELLVELLQQRFGSLSRDVKEKISGADSDSIRIWSENIFTASRLDEVFKSKKRN